MTVIDQPDQSAAPRILPAPVHVRDDPASLAPKDRPGHENPRRKGIVSAAIAKVASALRGDKYMVDAYAAAPPEEAHAPDHSASSMAGKR
jgi:hypothetical protein